MSTYPNKLFLPGLNFLHLSLKQVVSSSGMKYYCIHVAKPCEIPMNWYAFSSARYQFKVVPSKKFVTDFFHWSWGMPLCQRKCSISWIYLFMANDSHSLMYILGLIFLKHPPPYSIPLLAFMRRRSIRISNQSFIGAWLLLSSITTPLPIISSLEYFPLLPMVMEGYEFDPTVSFMSCEVFPPCLT